jgi:DoxX-like family
MENVKKTDKQTWLGRGLSVLAVLPFILSASMKFSRSAQMLEGWKHFGWSDSMILPIGILEISCVVLYLIPRISVLGAIILTGYLGGAISTHLRLGESVAIHVVIGLLIWGGLYFRERRLREILPVRK